MNDGGGTLLVIDADRRSKRGSGATDIEVMIPIGDDNRPLPYRATLKRI